MATAEISQLTEAYFIDSIKHSFVDVPIDAERDNAVSTTEFLDAAESLITIFDLLGGIAFKPVKSDMAGNIAKLRARQLAAPAESETIQDLVRNEIKSGKHVAAEGLIWLLRGLDFTCIGLRQNLASNEEELSVSFTSAYAATLKPHHNWLVKPVFAAAMNAVPYRKTFYAKLGPDQETVNQQLSTYLIALNNVVAILKGFMETKDAKW